jgi:hypothetical protein
MFHQCYTPGLDQLVMLGEVSFLSIGLVNVYGISSAVKQGLHLHEMLGMLYWRDFYGQGYILMIERADTSIVWDFPRCVSRSGIKHRFGAPAELQFYWRPYLAIII